MIKILAITFFLLNNIYAQDTDSLFWFDTKALKNNPPEFPLIINKVLTLLRLSVIILVNNLLSEIHIFLK